MEQAFDDVRSYVPKFDPQSGAQVKNYLLRSIAAW